MQPTRSKSLGVSSFGSMRSSTSSRRSGVGDSAASSAVGSKQSSPSKAAQPSEAPQQQTLQQQQARTGETALRLEEEIAAEVIGGAFDPLPDGANVDEVIDELLPKQLPRTAGNPGGPSRLHLRGHADSVRACCFDEHHRLLFTASWDGNVLVWNLEFFESPIARLQHREWVNAVAVTYVPDLTVLSATEDGFLFGWQCEQLMAERQLQRAAEGDGSSGSPAGGGQHQRRFEVVAQVQVSHGALTHLAVHGDFNFAFVSCGDTTFAVHLSSGSVIREYVTATEVSALAAVDAVLCIAQQSGAITVYDIVGSFILRELTGHRGAVRCISVVDPYTVMTAGDDCSVRVWNLASGACQSNRRRVHSRAITSISHFYTDRDRLVVTAGMDGAVKVTRQSNGRVVAAFGLLSTCVCVVPPIHVDDSNVEEVVDLLTAQVRGGGAAGAAAAPVAAAFGSSSKLWEEAAGQMEYSPSAVYNMRNVTDASDGASAGDQQLHSAGGAPLTLPGTARVISDAHVTRSARWSFTHTLICGGPTGRVTRLSLEAAVNQQGAGAEAAS